MNSLVLEYTQCWDRLGVEDYEEETNRPLVYNDARLIPLKFGGESGIPDEIETWTKESERIMVSVYIYIFFIKELTFVCL
jgi:hypothetical protein